MPSNGYAGGQEVDGYPSPRSLQAVRRIILTDKGRSYIENSFRRVQAPPPVLSTNTDYGQWHVYYDTKHLTLERQDACLREQKGFWELRAYGGPSVEDKGLLKFNGEDGRNAISATKTQTLRSFTTEKDILERLGLDVQEDPAQQMTMETPKQVLNKCATSSGVFDGGEHRKASKEFSLAASCDSSRSTSSKSPIGGVTASLRKGWSRHQKGWSSSTVNTAPAAPAVRKSVKVGIKQKLFAAGLRPVARLKFQRTFFAAEMAPVGPMKADQYMHQLLIEVERVEFDTAQAEPAYVADLLERYGEKAKARSEALQACFAEIRVVVPSAFHITASERRMNEIRIHNQVNQFLNQHGLNSTEGRAAPAGSLVVAYLRTCRPVHFQSLVEAGLFSRESSADEVMILEALPFAPLPADGDSSHKELEGETSDEDDQIYHI